MFKGFGDIPTGEFVDIEWIFAKNVMASKVNGEMVFTRDRTFTLNWG